VAAYFLPVISTLASARNCLRYFSTTSFLA